MNSKQNQMAIDDNLSENVVLNNANIKHNIDVACICTIIEKI